MDGLQVFAIVVSAVELALLLIVFIVKASRANSFVSTELEALSSFRLLLTIFAINTILLSLVYVGVRSPRGPRLCTAAASAMVGILGWAMLSASDMDSPLHTVGVCAFLLGQGGLLLIQFMLASAFGAAFYAGYAGTCCCAVLFIVLEMTGNLAAAAMFEWIGFISNAALLVLFWVTNPFPPPPQALRPEAVPLVVHEMVASGWV